jgi:hypothetical protein
LPLRVDTLTASTPARANYFSAPCIRILYGAPDRPTRWHRLGEDLHQDRGHGRDDVLGVELLVPDPEAEPRTALAVLHLTAPGDTQLELLRSAAGRRGADAVLPDLDALIHPYAVAVTDRRAFTVAFRTSSRPRPTPPPGYTRRLGWSPEQAWLWHLASRSTQADYPPDPEHADRLLAGALVLSADWRGLVTRDGAAFVALRPDRGPTDPFYNYAQLYTHTTYLDALLLGMIQRDSVERMVTESAAAFEAEDLPRHLEHLEQRAARFRTIYWLRDASRHGHANDILNAYHTEHELPERFNTVLNEIADLGRITQTQESQRIGAALGVLTIVGLPLGTALETLQALGADTPRDLLVALGIALAVTGALLTTRLGRLLIRQLRQLR